MPHDPERHHRRSIRLEGYDYRTPGLYVVTICIQHRRPLLGEIIDGEVRPAPAADMVQTTWNEIPWAYPGVEIDAFVVMPNHIHGIIYLLPGDIEFDPDSTWGAGHAGHRQAQRPAPTGNPIAGVGADPRVCPSPRNPGPDLGTMPPVDANQGARIGEPGQTQGSAPTGNRAHAGNPSHTRANSGNPPRVGADPGVCPSSDNARFDHGDPRAQGNGQTQGQGQTQGSAPTGNPNADPENPATGVGADPCVCPSPPNPNVDPGNTPNADATPKGDDAGGHRQTEEGDGPPRLSVSDVVKRFKSLTTHRYGVGVRTLDWEPYRGRLWQRNYYETIVRTETDLERFRRYIEENPIRWANDRHNPNNPEIR
jgi:REP element-mobilizing transposase RayT